MKWYRFFKTTDAGTTVTMASGVTLAPTTLTATTATLTTATITAGSIAGSSIVAFNGIANSSTPARKGDLGVDYSAGKLYVAGGTSASTDWKLVTSA